jgi:mono/diheme cytochrome c family protein
MKKSIISFSLICLVGMTAIAADAPWKAPWGASNMQNPVPANADSIAAGQKIFLGTGQCVSCHGTSGIGDGAAGAQLTPKPANLTKIVAETDGALFWKISTGKGAMPPTKDTLTDTERWEVINFIRSLKK